MQIARDLGVSTRTIALCVKLNSLSLVPVRNGGLGPSVMPSDAGRQRSASAGPNSHGHRLDRFDQSVIQVGFDQGWSMAKIAARIGVHATTVSREMKCSTGPAAALFSVPAGTRLWGRASTRNLSFAQWADGC